MSEPPTLLPGDSGNEPPSLSSPGAGATPEILLASAATPPAGLGPYRRSDYDRLPEDLPRCELISGRFYASPTPSHLHQVVVSCMVDCLLAQMHWLDNPSAGLLFYWPLEVALANHSLVLPDVSYVSRPRVAIVQERRVDGVPDILVEVVSPETSRRDRGEKLLLYAACGVPEYWIVEPDTEAIEFLVNQSATFVASPSPATAYQSPLLAEVRLDLGEFWRSVERRLPYQTIDLSGGPAASE